MLLVQQLGWIYFAECINASDAGNKWCWSLPVIKWTHLYLFEMDTNNSWSYILLKCSPFFRSGKTMRQNREENTFCNLVEQSPQPTRVWVTRVSPPRSPQSQATAGAALGRGSEAERRGRDRPGGGDTSGCLHKIPETPRTRGPLAGELSWGREYFVNADWLLVSRAAEKQSSQPLSGMEQSWCRVTLGRWPEGKTGCK